MNLLTKRCKPSSCVCNEVHMYWHPSCTGNTAYIYLSTRLFQNCVFLWLFLGQAEFNTCYDANFGHIGFSSTKQILSLFYKHCPIMNKFLSTALLAKSEQNSSDYWYVRHFIHNLQINLLIISPINRKWYRNIGHLSWISNWMRNRTSVSLSLFLLINLSLGTSVVNDVDSLVLLIAALCELYVFLVSFCGHVFPELVTSAEPVRYTSCSFSWGKLLYLKNRRRKKLCAKWHLQQISPAR